MLSNAQARRKATVISGMLLLALVCLSSIPPSLRADGNQVYKWNKHAWNISYKISEANVKPGDALSLSVNFTANVVIYDLRVEVASIPVQIVSNNVWKLNEVNSALPESQIFQVQIPTNAPVPGGYQIDLYVQGYKNPPTFDFLGWRPHGFLWWSESPEYTGNTTETLGDSIVLTVV